MFSKRPRSIPPPNPARCARARSTGRELAGWSMASASIGCARLPAIIRRIPPSICPAAKFSRAVSGRPRSRDRCLRTRQKRCTPASGTNSFRSTQKRRWRRGVHRDAIAFTWETIRWLELHGDTGVDGGFGAAIGAGAGGRDSADAGCGVVIKAELVLPVTVGNPDVNEVRVLRAHEGLAGVTCQTDRFGVELSLAGVAEPTDT